MTDTPAAEKKTKETSDWRMPPFREWVAAAIALTIMAGAVVLIAMAAQSASSDSASYDRLKDLLLFINPLIGVVIGYYFNKATSEGRAENAEKTAQSATEMVQGAVQMRDDALAQASTATSQTEEVKATLEEVTQCANDMMAAPADQPSGLTTLSLDEQPLGASAASNEERLRSRMRMQSALERAQKVLKSH